MRQRHFGRQWTVGIGVLGGVTMISGLGCATTGGATDTTVSAPVLPPAPAALLRQVADRVLLDFPEPPPFDWGEGVLMVGMMRAGVVLDEPKYVEFVRRWADHWRTHGIERLLEEDVEKKLRGYCGQWGPGFAVILLYEQTQDRAYLDMARAIADFMLTKATRTSDGGLGHWEGNYQLWVDTLFMAGPLFTRIARIEDRPDLLKDAVLQMNVYAYHLQEPESGLFYHMYDEPSRQRVGVLWGRGNGWTAMSYVEVLRHVERTSQEFLWLMRDYRRLMRGLMKTRDRASGLWHTVLDRPESYIETSASAMVLSSLAEAKQAKLLEVEPALLEDIWRGLATRVNANGHVFGVSGGTIPEKYEVYAEKIRGTYTWGTGAFLMAASALHELEGRGQ